MEEENKFKRTIKTYVLRAGRMTDHEKKSYEQLKEIYCIPFSNEKIDYKKIFNNDNPVVMEIGFGMGAATAQIAQNNPDINYLGSEVHVPGIGKLLSEINKRELKNLYILPYDALEILDEMIPDNSLSAFHIFFPDPWPKKKHHKRRMLQRPRTNLLASKLTNGGYLYFATDWEEYAFSALEELSLTDGLKNKYEAFAPHQEWRPQTKFEAKGIEAGRKIYELIFVKQ